MKSVHLLLATCVLLHGCVQPTYEKTVVYKLTTDGSNRGSVNVLGSDKPLDWEEGLAMSELVKDSVYQATVTYRTGYKFTEVKFAVDGKLELKDQPNRRVEFSETDTTYYDARFNVPK